MAVTKVMQLENGKGLGKVVVFTGLSHSMVIHPMVHGDPLLTAQAFYYIDELDSVASVNFDGGATPLTDQGTEYLVDNYLYEYSKRYPNSRLTCKGFKGRFWEQSDIEHYQRTDGGRTEVLLVDAVDDEHVRIFAHIDDKDTVDLEHWDVGRNYSQQCLGDYISRLTVLLDKRVQVSILPSEQRVGYEGKFRVVKPDVGLIDYYTAMAMADIAMQDLQGQQEYLQVLGRNRGETWCSMWTLSVERITAHAYKNPTLLAHYFAASHELNALKAFMGYYNILEFYFDAAPGMVGRVVNGERNQLECVLQLIVSSAEIVDFISSLPRPDAEWIRSEVITSTQLPIRGLSRGALGINELARWLYEIRCAVVHSKRTKRGLAVAAFHPYTAEAQALAAVLPLMQWLSVKCIEADSALNEPCTPLR